VSYLGSSECFTAPFLFFRSVGNRLKRNPSDANVSAAVRFVLATRGIALGRGVLAKPAR
jgi:hypothetical protein